MRSTNPLVRCERTFVVRCWMPSTARSSSYGGPFGLAAELAAVVGDHGADGNPQMLLETQHAVVQQVAGRDWHLRRVDLREGEGARAVGDDLHVDLADALEGAPVKRVLIPLCSSPGRDASAWGLRKSGLWRSSSLI
jgi:hypothetical protein